MKVEVTNAVCATTGCNPETTGIIIMGFIGMVLIFMGITFYIIEKRNKTKKESYVEDSEEKSKESEVY